MATINNLVLTVSRDSQDRVGVKVTYTVKFTPQEKAMNVIFDESVVVYDRAGREDEFNVASVHEDPAVWVRMRYQKDAPDKGIARLYEDSLDPSKVTLSPMGEADRTVERWLTADELAKFRAAGREHPLVAVTVVPRDVVADVSLARLDIDIGDPGE